MRSRNGFSPRGAVCVVTGASSGLGRRFATDLASAGAATIGVARRGDLLASLEDELRRKSPRSAGLRCDVSDVAAYIRLLETIEQDHGRIDVLVNCAGIPEPSETRIGASDEQGPSLDVRLQPVLGAYRKVMETNFFAAVAGTEAVLSGMLRRGSGIVVNVSSDSGRAPGPGEPAYCASKAALSAYTESRALAIEESGVSGVRLHVLYPGWVPTAMGAGAVEGGMQLPPKMVRRTEEQVSRLLLARMGGPRIDIDATLIARLAPVGKALAPGAYKKAVLKASGEQGSHSR